MSKKVGKRSKRVIGAVNAGPRGMETIIRQTKGYGASVKFGAVTIETTGLDQNLNIRSVEEGQLALARAAKKIAEPGVSIKALKGVPLYSVDEMQPGRLVRKLNGKTERGVLENGQFKVVHE